MAFPLTKIVEIHWDDACTSGGWDSLRVYKRRKMANVVSVGYLLSRTDESVSIATSQTDYDDINQCIVIPAKWVKKYRVLRK